MENELNNVKIADFNFLVTPYSDEPIINNFIVNDSELPKNTISVNVNEGDITGEKSEAIESQQRGHLFSTAIHRKIAEKIPNYNSFVLHSVIFDVNGEGVAFCALSGTGKSTHLANWYIYINGTDFIPDSLANLLSNSEIIIPRKKQFPLTIVNGDKPIIRFFEKDFCEKQNLKIPINTECGIPYAYGTPWNGKERLGCNGRTPLKHICFIERSETNYVTKIEKNDAINRIMQQVYMPKDPVALVKTLELVNRLISYCDLWIIHCNMEIESAEVAYNAIFGNNENK